MRHCSRSRRTGAARRGDARASFPVDDAQAGVGRRDEVHVDAGWQEVGFDRGTDYGDVVSVDVGDLERDVLGPRCARSLAGDFDHVEGDVDGVDAPHKRRDAISRK